MDAALIAAGLKGLRYPGWPADGRRRDIWAVALDFPLAREKIIPALRQALGGHNLIRKWYERDQTFVLHNGARIIVKSCVSRETKFQSVQVDHIWFDEAPPHEIWKECQPRILARDGTIAVSMTPTRGMDWIHDRYYKPWEERTAGRPVETDGLLFVMMDLLDNPYIPAHAAKEMIADLVDEDEVAEALDAAKRLRGLFGR